MEDNITSSLNLFDIISRMVPGTLALVLIGGLFPSLMPLDLGEYGDATGLFLLFVAPYVTGTLVRAMARPALILVRFLVYGGNPRDRYLDEPYLYMGRYKLFNVAVIEEASVRRLGRACAASIARWSRVSNVTPRFALGIMINRLESEGKSGKGDRMLCLAEMCASLGMVFLVAAIATLIIHGEIGRAVVLAVCAGLNYCLYFRYERLRYTTVVRTYAISFKIVENELADESNKKKMRLV